MACEAAPYGAQLRLANFKRSGGKQTVGVFRMAAYGAHLRLASDAAKLRMATSVKHPRDEFKVESQSLERLQKKPKLVQTCFGPSNTLQQDSPLDLSLQFTITRPQDIQLQVQQVQQYLHNLEDPVILHVPNRYAHGVTSRFHDQNLDCEYFAELEILIVQLPQAAIKSDLANAFQVETNKHMQFEGRPRRLQYTALDPQLKVNTNDLAPDVGGWRIKPFLSQREDFRKTPLPDLWIEIARSGQDRQIAEAKLPMVQTANPTCHFLVFVFAKNGKFSAMSRARISKQTDELEVKLQSERPQQPPYLAYAPPRQALRFAPFNKHQHIQLRFTDQIVLFQLVGIGDVILSP